MASDINGRLKFRTQLRCDWRRSQVVRYIRTLGLVILRAAKALWSSDNRITPEVLESCDTP